MKTLRIDLPVEYHIRLHRIKLVTGQSMSEVIRQALDVRLAQLEPMLKDLFPPDEPASAAPLDADPLMRRTREEGDPPPPARR